MLVFQPNNSNVGPDATGGHDVRTFQRSDDDSLAWYLSSFRQDTPKERFCIASAGTKKMRGEKSRIIVVVPLREVPYATFSCPFRMFNCRTFLKCLSFVCFCAFQLVSLLSPSENMYLHKYFHQSYRQLIHATLRGHILNTSIVY